MTRAWAIAGARMRALRPILVACAILGLLAVVGSGLDQTFRFRDDIRWLWYLCALFLSIFGGLALGVHAALAPRRALLEAAERRMGVSVGILVAPTLVGLAGAGILTVPVFLAGLLDRVLAAEPLPDATQVSAFAAFLVLATGAAVSSGAALITLVRSPFVAIPGVVATGVVACGVLAALLAVFGPIDVAVAAPFAGLLAAWIGSALGAVLGIAEPNLRTASFRTALALPSGGILIGTAALVTAGSANDEPPSRFSHILAVESAPAGPWALVTGELRFSARRHHALVDFEHGRWYRVRGPVQGLAFTPDGREARWVEGGMFGSSLVRLDLDTGRRQRCGGLPRRSPLLDTDTRYVALAAGHGVRVLDAETCKAVATTEEPARSARFQGDELLTETVVIRLPDGTVRKRAIDEPWSEYVRAVSPEGDRAVVMRHGRVLIRDETTLEVLAEGHLVDALHGTMWLGDGTIVTLGGEPMGCGEIQAFDAGLVEIPLPARATEPREKTSVNGVTTYAGRQIAIQAGPSPSELLVCGCGPCDLLDVARGTWQRLDGPTTPGVGWYDQGELPRSGASRYARDDDGRVYAIDSSGATPLTLPG